MHKDKEITRIEKRDGTTANFSKEKIDEAIWRAAKAVGGMDKELSVRLGSKVIQFLKLHLRDDEVPRVNQVQDIVEKVLVKNGHYKTAKAYIIYRDQHDKMRQMTNLVSNNQLVEEYVSMDDWTVRENANMSYSLQGLNFHVSSKITSQYWLNKIYPREIREGHHSGDFHIHDLGTLSVYCVGHDLQDLLTVGFKGVKGKVECKPPKHFRTALGQLVNFFYTLQGEAAGAQAISNFDTLLAPFIKYDNLTYAQVKQALQEFLFNLNVPTRVGFQTPFTNVTLDLEIPKKLGDKNVIIGGKEQEETYKEFDTEVKMFNRAFCEVLTEGDGNGRVFTFPVPTYNLTKDFDWDNPEYKILWEMTAKYGIPNFSNYIGSDDDPSDVTSMCCRLRLDNRKLEKRGGGLFGARPLTGSIGVVTINMARLGYKAKDEEDFKRQLARLMDISKESLDIKRKLLEDLTDKGLYPYTKYYLRNIRKGGAYWRNHFSTFGLVGMNEAVINFMGKSIGEPEGKEFAEKILDFMNEKLSDYQEANEEILYNLEATPAEGTSFSLALKDKKLYNDIKTAGEEVSYYTNSTQLPVNFTDDIFKALKLQDELQQKYTSGTNFHVFIGENNVPAESVKNLVRKIAMNFKMPTFTISPTFSICPKHGYMQGEHPYCPKCDEEYGIDSKTGKARITNCSDTESDEKLKEKPKEVPKGASCSSDFEIDLSKDVSTRPIKTEGM